MKKKYKWRTKLYILINKNNPTNKIILKGVLSCFIIFQNKYIHIFGSLGNEERLDYSLYQDQPQKLFPLAQDNFNKNKFEEGITI